MFFCVKTFIFPIYGIIWDIPYAYICMYIYIYTCIYMYINCFHLKKGLYSKHREFNKVILRAVSHIVLLRCRLIYNQHYAPYEHIYIYVYIYVYIYSASIHNFPRLIPFLYDGNFNFIIILCRFLINVIKLCKRLSKLDLPTLHKGF